VKYAAQLLGFCREDIRAPLATLRPESKQAVARALEQAGVS